MSNEEQIPDEPQAPSKQEAKREVVEFVKMIVWFLIVFFVVKCFVVEGYEVQGPSMVPTLQDRERILVFKLPHLLSRGGILRNADAIGPGDIVVFNSPVETDKRYVKRVIAEGPDKPSPNTASAQQQGHSNTVGVRFDQGAVYVNNKRLAEPYLPAGQRVTEDAASETVLQPGGYYVLGDNRTVSKDSRSFGAIDDASIIGRAVVCFWPPSRIRLLR